MVRDNTWSGNLVCFLLLTAKVGAYFGVFNFCLFAGLTFLSFVDGFFLDVDGGEFLVPRVLVFPFLLALVVADLAFTLLFVVTFAFFVPIALSSPASAKSSSEFDGSTTMEDRHDIASAAAIRSACSFSSIEFDVDSFCFLVFRLVVIICIFSGLKIDVNVRILIHIAEIHISRYF